MKARDGRGVKLMNLKVNAKSTRKYEVREMIRREIICRNRLEAGKW